MVKEEKKVFFKTVSKVLNYFVLPIFIIGFLAIITMSFATSSGAMPNFFGISIVRIESGSMVEQGFNVGDVVLMTQKYEKPIKKGDIVAFYNKKDSVDAQKYKISTSMQNSELVLIEEFEGEFAQTVEYISGRTKPQNLKNQNYKITFHQVINVYVGQDGVVFYETKGSNPNASSDGLIRQDFVVAQYVNTPFLLKLVMSFIITPIGFVLTVLLPLSIIVGIEGYNILKKFYAYHLEGQLFKRKLSYKDDIIRTYEVESLMSLPRKVYFWLTSPKLEKEQVFTFLFKVRNPKDLEEVALFQNALKSKEIFENKGALEYFRFWHLTVGGYFDKKEIIKYKKMYEKEFLNLNKDKE